MSSPLRSGRSNLGTRTILDARGSLPKCAGQVVRPLLGGEAGGRSLGFLLHQIGFPIAISGGFLLAKKPRANGTVICSGGNSDQLVRLANSGRLADGDRHRQHDLLFAGGAPRRIA